MRVLIIEDDPRLQAQLRERLESEAYRVDACGDGREGLFLASEYPHDAAIVDLGLPGMPGIDVIRALREKGSELPILVLTARDRWQDKVEGLEAGADDYLTKPFQTEELLARLKALLRRAAKAMNMEIREFGSLKIDFSAQRVSREGQTLELTAYEYRLLEYLLRHAGEVVAKSTLADYLYPHDEDRDSNVIEVLVGRLRRKLDPGNRSKPIETLRGRGYRFALEGGGEPEK